MDYRARIILCLAAALSICVEAPLFAEAGSAISTTPAEAGSGKAAPLSNSGSERQAKAIATEAVDESASAAPVCSAPPDIARLSRPLTRTARLLAGGLPIKIVAIGSSSTAGAGASSPATSYPSRLAVELSARFPDHQFIVLNRGVNGEETADMLARFDNDVIAENPDLVLWQVGTNALLRDRALLPASSRIQEGVARLKRTGADVILLDPQFAPKVIIKPEAGLMVDLLATTAKEHGIDIFRRFAVMRYWHEAKGMGFETFIAPDQLHMNDWSYSCLAKILSVAIAEAATRPVTSASAGPVR